MTPKEATARIKINKLLETAGWRFFPDGNAPANVRLELSVTIKSSDLDALGNDFEKTSKGFVDFMLAFSWKGSGEISWGKLSVPGAAAFDEPLLDGP